MIDTVTDNETDERPGVIGWLAFVFVCGSALLGAVLELLFLTQLYFGTVIIPFVIIAAVLGNYWLPRWGHSSTQSTLGAVLPIAIWLLVIVIPTIYARPEGDIFVLGAHGQEYAYYGLLFIGAIVGVGSVVVLTARR